MNNFVAVFLTQGLTNCSKFDLRTESEPSNRNMTSTDEERLVTGWLPVHF